MPRFASGSPLGDRYAQLAHLEAASIAAFERLAQELSDAGAPRRLVAAARSAARDEARHARMMSRLAAQSGGKPETPVTGPTDSRSLTAMAEENAVEGCVRETVGAALALAQARAAPSRQLRRLWETIARDEAEHAQLAWDVNAWLQPKLSNAARRRIARSQRVALAAMRKECGVEDPLGAELGAPSAEGKRALFAALERELPWPKA